jgi:hypothetical protein
VEWDRRAWSISFAGIVWFHIEGLKANLPASDRPRSHILLAVAIVPAAYVITLVEAWASC